MIDCGVDTETFVTSPRAEGEGPRYLVAGSLTGRKNLGRLMEAFGRLGSGTLTVAGAGPLEAELRAAAPERVTFLGRVEPSRMPELYRACDVYCQPSLVEPQGQALLEALASGRPWWRPGWAGRRSTSRPPAASWSIRWMSRPSPRGCGPRPSCRCRARRRRRWRSATPSLAPPSWWSSCSGR